MPLSGHSWAYHRDVLDFTDVWKLHSTRVVTPSAATGTQAYTVLTCPLVVGLIGAPVAEGEG